MNQSKPNKKRRALGRGLGALLDENTTESKAVEEKLSTDVPATGGVNEIPVGEIEVNPFQPRTEFDQEALAELSESIKLQGIIQPITVRKLTNNSYQLIAGERRLQASKLAGLEQIPAYIRMANDQQMLEMALIENIQRENLNAMEIALSYQRLLSECDLKQEELGDRVGKKRTTVNNYLRLLKLPPDIQAGIRDGLIGMGHARALVNIDNIELQLDIYNKAVQQELSVRKVEDMVRKSHDEAASKPGKQDKPKELPYEYKQIQDQLASHFGTKVVLKRNDKSKGEIKIPYMSQDDLNRIIDLLNL